MIQSIEDGNLNNVQKSIEKGASVNCVNHIFAGRPALRRIRAIRHRKVFI